MSHLGFAAISLGMLGLSAAGVRIDAAYRDVTAVDVAGLVAKHCFLMVPLTLVNVLAFAHLGADVLTMSVPGATIFTAALVALVGALVAGPEAVVRKQCVIAVVALGADAP